MAQEQRIVVQVVESGVCHGQDTVTFTWRQTRRGSISLDVMKMAVREIYGRMGQTLILVPVHKLNLNSLVEGLNVTQCNVEVMRTLLQTLVDRDHGIFVFL